MVLFLKENVIKRHLTLSVCQFPHVQNELEVDVTTLKRRISDLETILTENRDRELAALGGRGVATSLSASRTSGLTASASGRHLVGPGGDGNRPEEVCTLTGSVFDWLCMMLFFVTCTWRSEPFSFEGIMY